MTLVIVTTLPRWVLALVIAVTFLAGVLIVVTLHEKLMHLVSKRRIAKKFQKHFANPDRTILP